MRAWDAAMSSCPDHLRRHGKLLRSIRQLYETIQSEAGITHSAQKLDCLYPTCGVRRSILVLRRFYINHD